MATAAVVARILTQYSDVGSKAAQKDLRRLEKKVSDFGKKAVKSFGIATAATAAFAVKIGVDAVKGAAADEKQQAALATALRNTTGATDAAIRANQEYLDNLELQVAIDNEQLIPALQRLVTATGDLSQAQALLSLSTDVSAASGKDLGAVSVALSKAVNGQFGALQKLGLPLDQNAIKARDLGKILVDLSRISAGQAQASANTFAGRLESLRLRVAQVSDKLGIALMPALVLFVDYIDKKIVPMLDIWITKNEDELNEALQGTVGNLKEVVEAFQDIYAVIEGVNAIVPLGIGGWIKLLVAISTFSTLAGGAAIAIKKFKDLKQMAGWTRGSQAAFKDLRAEFGFFRGAQAKVISVFQGIGRWADKSTGFIALMIKGVKFLFRIFLQTPWGRAAALVAGLTYALYKLAKQFNWFGMGSNRVKLSGAIEEADASMTNAVRNFDSMDAALNRYRAAQDKKITLTKDEIATNKLLAQINARSLADMKKAEAQQKALLKAQGDLAKFKNAQGVGLTTKEEDIAQLNAAVLLQKRQENAKKADLDRLEMLKSMFKTQDDLARLEQVRSDILVEYNKNLRYQNDLMVAYQDDLKITADEIQTLSDRWGISTEEVEKYTTVFLALVDEKIDSTDIQNVAKAFGLGTAEAKKYLEAVLAIKHGTLDAQALQRLADEWKIPVNEALKYIHTVALINNPTAKLSSAGVETLKSTWGDTNDELAAYLNQIKLPFNYDGSMLKGVDDLIARLKEALELIKKIQGGTSATASSSASSSGKASADAVKEAADAAAAAADAAAALAAGPSAAAAVAAIITATTTKEINAAVSEATKAKVSASEIANSMVTGLLGQGVSTQNALSASRYTGQAIAAQQRAEQEAAEVALRNQQYAEGMAKRYGGYVGTPSDAGMTLKSPTMDAADGGFKGLRGGGDIYIDLNVQGDIQTKEDIVSAIRQGLLAGQTNGQTLTLQAI